MYVNVQFNFAGMSQSGMGRKQQKGKSKRTVD